MYGQEENQVGVKTLQIKGKHTVAVEYIKIKTRCQYIK